MPAPTASARRAAASARSSLSVAARVASVVTVMPDAAYGRPAIRAANSSARSPAKTRCVWLSTKPGITQRPAASSCSSALAPAGSIAATRSPSTTIAASRTIPSGPSPSAGSHVTSRPMLSMTRLIRSPLGSRRPARGARPPPCDGRPRRSACPSTTTCRTSAALAAKTTDSSAVSGSVPASRTLSRPTVTRSARAPGSIRPRLGPAETGVAARRWPRAAARPRRGCPARRSPAARRAPRRAPPRTGR